MGLPRFASWRLFFVLAALFLLNGGPRHPRGGMEVMLGHPDWVLSHVLLLAGYLLSLVGLILFRKNPSLPERTLRWARFAIIGTALQAVEMIFHTAAVVDHGNLLAGHSTPILSTHFVLSLFVHPLFAIGVIGLIIAGVRDRSLGSPWIAWLGILGATAHALAPLAVIVLKIPGANILFAMLMFLALWYLLAAFWPSRKPAS